MFRTLHAIRLWRVWVTGPSNPAFLRSLRVRGCYSCNFCPSAISVRGKPPSQCSMQRIQVRGLLGTVPIHLDNDSYSCRSCSIGTDGLLPLLAINHESDSSRTRTRAGDSFNVHAFGYWSLMCPHPAASYSIFR